MANGLPKVPKLPKVLPKPWPKIWPKLKPWPKPLPKPWPKILPKEIENAPRGEDEDPEIRSDTTLAQERQ